MGTSRQHVGGGAGLLTCPQQVVEKLEAQFWQLRSGTSVSPSDTDVPQPLQMEAKKESNKRQSHGGRRDGGRKESFYTSASLFSAVRLWVLFLFLSCRFTLLCARKLAKLFLPPHTHTR